MEEHDAAWVNQQELKDEPKPICPECAANKHRNCDGMAFDSVRDEITVCGCDCP